MKLACILVLFVLSIESPPPFVLLKKYGSAIMTDRYVLFESKEFDDDEEIYFKLQAGIDDFDLEDNESRNIKYYYTDSTGTTSTSPYYAYRKSYDTEERSIENNYLKKKKKRSEYRSTKWKLYDD